MIPPLWFFWRFSGGRGYYLIREGPLLNQALISYALQFAYQRGFTPVHTPFFMRKEIMAECAQLSEFDEALYHVSGVHAWRNCGDGLAWTGHETNQSAQQDSSS